MLRLAVKCHFPLQGDFTTATVALMFWCRLNIAAMLEIPVTQNRFLITCIFACFVLVQEPSKMSLVALNQSLRRVCTSMILLHHLVWKAVTAQ